jgi:hypothetical protein
MGKMTKVKLVEQRISYELRIELKSLPTQLGGLFPALFH